MKSAKDLASNAIARAVIAAAPLPPEAFDRPAPRRFTPANCPHCEYDRRFPGFEAGGWIRQDNNGPIVSCPMCNPNGAIPRQLD